MSEVAGELGIVWIPMAARDMHLANPARLDAGRRGAGGGTRAGRPAQGPPDPPRDLPGEAP